MRPLLEQIGPVLLMVASDDEEVSPQICVQLAAAVEARGGRIQLVYYEGAHHAYDDPGPRKQSHAPNRAALESSGAETLRAKIRYRLAEHNAANPGASTSVRRVLLLQEPPNPGAHELSDKGTVNRSAVLARRAADVERLYAEPPGEDVIRVE